MCFYLLLFKLYCSYQKILNFTIILILLLDNTILYFNIYLNNPYFKNETKIYGIKSVLVKKLSHFKKSSLEEVWSITSLDTADISSCTYT